MRRIPRGAPRRALLRTVLSALVLALAACAQAPPPPAAGPVSTVVLVSLDGTRPADLDSGALPSLAALARRGARAKRLVPVFPTNTFPNHVSLVTGVSPARHGVVNNDFVDPERGRFDRGDIPSWLEAEPLWSLLARRGVVSASCYWVGSEGAWPGPGGSAPRHWLPFSAETPESAKVEQILAWLDLDDPAERPRFITSWFHGADHAGHVFGPGSPEVAEALRRQDPAIAALVRGIEERGLFASTTLIFVSDHGMSGYERRVDLGATLLAAGLPATVLGIGGFASLVLPDADQAARAVRIARSLGLSAWRREEAPPELGLSNPRFGDAVVVAPLGTALLPADLALLGVHGYRADEPAMAGIFVAAGRGVRQGTVLESVRTIDVAPTVLALLGSEVPQWMEGRPVPELSAAP